jgi:hypothetical protein
MFENPTINLDARCTLCAKIACCSSELIFTFFMQVAASEMVVSNRLG